MARNPKRETTFRFKQFAVANNACAMKIGTDGVLLGAWASSVSEVRQILDIGTGTGLIALMLAQRFDDTGVTAIEIDEAAAAEAEENVLRSPWADRITVVNADFNKWNTDSRFDLIVSNPPFFTTGLRAPDSQRATARHTDTLSFSDLLGHASRMLSCKGHICIITPTDVSDQITFEAAINRLNVAEKCYVTTVSGKAPSRILWNFTPADVKTVESSLVIRTTDGYSSEYRRLTDDFYIHF